MGFDAEHGAIGGVEQSDMTQGAALVGRADL